MKKLVLFVIIAAFSLNGYSQKKKTTKKSDAVSLAKLGSLSAEISKNIFYLLNQKDTIAIKSINTAVLPINCKITAFKSKNTAFHMLSWTEITTVEVPKKNTVTTVSYSKIYDLASKSEVCNNIQTNTNIKEQVQLGKTAASETQERNRNEGYILTILPNGDINLVNKTQTKKMSYDVGSKVFK